MNIEYELKVLEIDVKKIEEKLITLGAEKLGDNLQRRYVYDFKPIVPHKWIRLRTNGKKTTLTIKEVKDNNSIGGTYEKEIEVSDFNSAHEILAELGYTPKSYQENRRITYKYEDIEIDIDFWPMIPTYMEIEGKSEIDVLNFFKKLDLENPKTTTYSVDLVYKEIYKIDYEKYNEIFLEEDRKN